MNRRLKRNEKRLVPLVAHTHPKLPITEQYRLIRTNLLFSSVEKDIKLLVVTSPESGDGKSTTAANLAIVLAQQGKQVLLVDTDLRKPSVHYTFKASNLNGLTSVLTKERTLKEAIIKTSISNLFILTSGQIPPNPSELLGTKCMEMIMEEMKQQFDYVVFDTPPILAVTDAQIIANKCDGVVLVVASEKTHREKALKAKELLEKAKSCLLGVVINGVNSKKSDYYRQYS